MLLWHVKLEVQVPRRIHYRKHGGKKSNMTGIYILQMLCVNNNICLNAASGREDCPYFYKKYKTSLNVMLEY